MDIGSSQIVAVIASSTTSNFAVYSPVFLLIGGLLLAFVVMAALVQILRGQPVGNIFADDSE